MTTEARTWRTGTTETVRSSLFGRLRLRTRAEQMTAATLLTVTLALPNIFSAQRVILLPVLAIVSALIVGAMAYRDDQQRSAFDRAVARWGRTARAGTNEAYESGATFAGTVIGGEAVPVSPPEWIGQPTYAQSTEGMGVVILPSEASVTAAIELSGRGGILRDEDVRGSDHDAISLILERCAAVGSHIDRVSILNRVSPTNLDPHRDVIDQADNDATLPSQLIESYDGAARTTEHDGETHRYWMVFRMTTTSKVQAIIRKTAPLDAPSAAPYYAKLMQSQMNNIIPEVKAVGYHIRPQIDVQTGQPRETLGIHDLLAITHTQLDPDHQPSAEFPETPNRVWPRSSEPADHDVRVDGHLRSWFHRAYTITDWPKNELPASFFASLWNLPERVETEDAAWGCHRTNVVVYEIVNRRAGIARARADASHDQRELKKAEQKGEISPDEKPLTESMQRVADIQNGAAPVRVNAFVIISVPEDANRLEPWHETLDNTALRLDSRVISMTGEHDLGLATALPHATGMKRERVGMGRK